MRGFIVILSSLFFLLASTQASALIDVQAFAGKRWLSGKTDGEESGEAYQHLGLAAHISIFPFIAAGVSVGQSSISSADKESHNLKSSTITEVGLDVIASFGMVPIVTPFVRANLPLSSVLKAEFEGDVTALAETVPLQTYVLNAGIKYSLIPLVALTAEVGSGVYMIKVKEIKEDGTNTAEDEDKNARGYKMDNFLVGVEIGF